MFPNSLATIAYWRLSVTHSPAVIPFKEVVLEDLSGNVALAFTVQSDMA